MVPLLYAFLYAISERPKKKRLWTKSVQQYGLFIMWTITYALKLLEVVHDFLQWGHLRGFSPVWTLECSLSCDGEVKDFSHNEYVNGFSPVWILMCILGYFESLKDFSHIEQ